MKAKGQDWVEFRLQADGPARVAMAAGRFAAVYERGAEPFRATRGDWAVRLKPLGFFEEVKPEAEKAAVVAAAPAGDGRMK